jgi:phosphoglycerol transferase MdoB-like AlkP superfamily enzyme
MQDSDRGAAGLLSLRLSALWRVAHVAAQSRTHLVVLACSAAAAATAFYFWHMEGCGPIEIAFATAISLAVAAAIAFVCRRVLPALVIAVSMVGIVAVISSAKQQVRDTILHAYDVVAVLESGLVLHETWHDYRDTLLGITIAVVAAGAATWFAALVDKARVPRRWPAVCFALLACLAWAADLGRGPRRHTEFYFENAYVLNFYSSWSETARALWRGTLIEADRPHPAASQLLSLAPPATCTPTAKAPHIILIHHESAVQPSLFPALDYDRSLDTFFRSADGRFNKLRVETFGGASWLTEFSVLTGLATQSFAGMNQLAQQIMTGGIRDSLPQTLARCGYRNVMFYPMLRHFLGAGRFFDSVGFDKIFDAKAQQAKLPNERDRFYYASALDEIGRHLQSSSQRLFLYVQTMATHGPYDYAYSPEVAVPGGGPGTPPETGEYLRRLAMSRMDYTFLRSELTRRFPDEAFLIVRYGDHQPTAVQSLLGFGDDASIEDIMASGNEAARVTYYAIDAVRYRPPSVPAVEKLDVAYLGTVVLESADVPLPSSYRERKRLMMLCNGRYQDCPEQQQILRFHRSLIDAGLIKAF